MDLIDHHHTPLTVSIQYLPFQYLAFLSRTILNYSEPPSWWFIICDSIEDGRLSSSSSEPIEPHRTHIFMKHCHQLCNSKMAAIKDYHTRGSSPITCYKVSLPISLALLTAPMRRSLWQNGHHGSSSRFLTYL